MLPILINIINQILYVLLLIYGKINNAGKLFYKELGAMSKKKLMGMSTIIMTLLFTITGCSAPSWNGKSKADASVFEKNANSEGAANENSTMDKNAKETSKQAEKEAIKEDKPQEIPPEDTSEDQKEPALTAPRHEGLDRGVNLGNALEAPIEGSWGVILEEDYFQKIKDAGFDFVRIPIRWSAHSQTEAPYTIDEQFFKRVDWAIDQCLSRELAAIINIHHFDEFMQNAEGNKERLFALWEQIAKRYAKKTNKLYFELLNEPTNVISAELWNQLSSELIKIIRKTNPKRYIVVGGVNWNNINSLHSLVLPKNDNYIIATFHYYNPFQFTHQGAEWAQGSSAWLGTPWIGNRIDKLLVKGELHTAVEWAVKNNVPLLMGEFGAYNKAEMAYRERWTRFLAREAEKRNISWAYWEFCSGFGVYDSSAGSYRTELLRALIPDSKMLKQQ